MPLSLYISHPTHSSIEIKAPKRNGSEFEEAENAVYIPRLGKSEVVTNIGDLQIKPQNYKG